MYYQHDGALAHFVSQVKQYSDGDFPGLYASEMRHCLSKKDTTQSEKQEVPFALEVVEINGGIFEHL